MILYHKSPTHFTILKIVPLSITLFPPYILLLARLSPTSTAVVLFSVHQFLPVWDESLPRGLLIMPISMYSIFCFTQVYLLFVPCEFYLDFPSFYGVTFINGLIRGFFCLLIGIYVNTCLLCCSWFSALCQAISHMRLGPPFV